MKTIVRMCAALLALGVGIWAQAGQDLESQLRSKYGKRLTFVTPKAKEIVLGFDIDCGLQDGRIMPLESLLLLRLSQMDRPDLWAVTSADSRGDVVQITDTVMQAGGKRVASELVFVVTEWGKLRPIESSGAAIRQACGGYWGKVWRMPKNG